MVIERCIVNTLLLKRQATVYHFKGVLNRIMRQIVTGKKYSAKTRCFRAVKFDLVTKAISFPVPKQSKLANIIKCGGRFK